MVGVKASPYGVRLANVGQEQGRKGDKLRTKRSDLVKQVTTPALRAGASVAKE